MNSQSEYIFLFLYITFSYCINFSINQEHVICVYIIIVNLHKQLCIINYIVILCSFGSYVKKDDNNSLEMTKWTFNMSLFISIYNEVFVKEDRVSELP